MQHTFIHTHAHTQSSQAMRRLPSVAVHSIRELMSPRSTKTVPLVGESYGDANEFEVSACASVLNMGACGHLVVGPG